jgi:RecA/RadA recombinase
MTTPSASIDHSRGRARRLRDALPAGLQQSVVRAADLARERHLRLRDEPMATSVAAFDRLLGGGLPRGCLVELVGRGSCGRFAALLAALTAVTDTGQAAPSSIRAPARLQAAVAVGSTSSGCCGCGPAACRRPWRPPSCW